MTTHYVLVAIDTPGLDDGDLAAEMVSSALQDTDEANMMYAIGSSGGPNPPYFRNAEIVSVTAETME